MFVLGLAHIADDLVKAFKKVWRLYSGKPYFFNDF